MAADPDGLYALLGVDPASPPGTISIAYRHRAKILHPDVPVTGDAAAFLALRQAYDVLADPAKRADYDRRAQLSADEPFVSRITPAPPAQSRSLWNMRRWGQKWVLLGIGAILILGTAMLMLEGQTSPKVERSTIPARAPTVGSDTSAARRIMPDPPALVPPAESATHFVLPAPSPARIWQIGNTNTDKILVGQLNAFTPVQVLAMFGRDGLAEVRLSANETGLVDPSRLAPGDRAAARRAYCAYQAGAPPVHGEILIQRKTGSARLELRNRSAQSMVVTLRDESGTVALSVFLASERPVFLDNLANGVFQAAFATGELWSRPCRSFAAGMRAQSVSVAWSLPALTPLVLPPDPRLDIRLTDMSDHAFGED